VDVPQGDHPRQEARLPRAWTTFGLLVHEPRGTRTCTAASWSSRTMQAPTSASSSSTTPGIRPRAGTGRSRS
jgi:hypothetical protein